VLPGAHGLRGIREPARLFELTMDTTVRWFLVPMWVPFVALGLFAGVVVAAVGAVVGVAIVAVVLWALPWIERTPTGFHGRNIVRRFSFSADDIETVKYWSILPSKSSRPRVKLRGSRSSVPLLALSAYPRVDVQTFLGVER